MKYKFKIKGLDCANCAVYNLSGMRIKTPSKGKINIINNKKVLVK